MRALLRKEFLETVRWWPLVLIVNCVLLWIAAGQQEMFSRRSPAIAMHTAIGAALTAVALGFLQFAFDQRSGARAYLLHRGVSARQVFWAKWIVGWFLYIAALGIPLAIAALWLESAGPMRLPTRAVQVVPSLPVVFAGFGFYAVTVLVICRPASWVGSRLVPPLAVAALYFLFCVFNTEQVTYSRMILTFLASILPWLGLQSCAAHAFVHDSRLPSPASAVHRRPVYTTVIFASVFIVCCLGMIFTTMLIESFFPTYSRTSFKEVLVDGEGKPWFVTSEYQWVEGEGQQRKLVGGERITPERTPNPSAPLPSDFKAKTMANLLPTRGNPSSDIAGIEGESLLLGRYTAVYDRRGYILAYDLYRPGRELLEFVISADGVHRPGEAWGTPFESDSRVSTDLQFMDERFLMNAVLRLPIARDTNGLYQIDTRQRTVHKILEQPIDQYAVIVQQDDEVLCLAESEGQISVYRIVDESGSAEWFQKNMPGMVSPSPVEFPQLKGELIDQFAVPTPLRESDSLSFDYRDKNRWTLAGSVNSRVCSLIAIQEPEKESPEVFLASTPYANNIPGGGMAFAGIGLPPALQVAMWAYDKMASDQPRFVGIPGSRPIRKLPAFLVVLCGLQMIAAGACAWWASKRRDLSVSLSVFYAALAAVVGWAVPLAILARYPRLVFEPCPRCEKPRRIDLVHCEHCRSPWEGPESDGTEILSSNRPESLSNPATVS